MQLELYIILQLILSINHAEAFKKSTQMTFLESPYEVSSPSMSESANRSLGSTSHQHSASRTSSLAGAAFPDRQTIHGHTGPFISRNEILENSEPDRHSWRNPAIAVADQATASPNLPRALAPWHEESALDAYQDPYYAWVDTGSPSPRSKAYLQSCMPTVTQSSKEDRQENFAVMSQVCLQFFLISQKLWIALLTCV